MRIPCCRKEAFDAEKTPFWWKRHSLSGPGYPIGTNVWEVRRMEKGMNKANNQKNHSQQNQQKGQNNQNQPNGGDQNK